MPKESQPKTPKKLGRFEVGAKIGGGGMATVYVGRNIREDDSEELVALKVIRDELAHDETFTSMFIDEAKILARLSHPNVIQTLEYGVTGHHHYIAMELLNGRTIADAFEVLVENRQRFELHVAAWICARVAEGLHSAHELADEEHQPLNVIHRDVNPTNIFVTHSGEVKLIDFGLARARVRVSKSAEGIVKGKIPYLAPEQARGNPIDRRIDLYALGTTLWEMSTMKRLFKRDNDIATLKAIRDAHVPNPRDENPDFPEALWKIIDRALKIDREERYATAEEMRTDLDAFARGSANNAKKAAELVSRLFPGDEAKQAKWMRDAASIRLPAGTMSPPAPVPIASSSLLEREVAHASEPPPATSPSKGGAPRRKLPPVTPPPKRTGTTPPPAATTSERPLKLADDEAPTTRIELPQQEDEPKADEKRDAALPPAAESSKRSLRPPAPPKAKKPGAQRKKRKLKPSSAVQKAKPPEEDKRKLWLITAVVVGVLLIIALLVSR